jgi:hypothetical protein
VRTRSIALQPAGNRSRPNQKMRKSFWLALLLLSGVGSALHAQALSVGLLAGAPFTDVVNNSSSLGSADGLFAIANSNNFTIGPSVRVNLPLSLRLEVDALYRPYGFDLFNGGGTQARISAQQWRFPVLLQYRFNTPVVKPFLEGGVSINHLGNLSDNVGGGFINSAGTVLRRSDTGVVLGGGVDVNLYIVHLSGELRYTRDTLANFANISNLNQAEVLFGIRF